MTGVPALGRGRRFFFTFLLFLLVLTLWAAAIPMFGASDENFHMVTSYGIVHGQGRGQTGSAGTQTYEAPPLYAPFPPCWSLSAFKTAACEKLGHGRTDHRIAVSTASYPPFYYVLVGWPTLFLSGRFSLYAMRFMSAILVALMMALAFDTLVEAHRPGPLVLGLAVALTPVAYFFGASVNPSGLAIAASLAAWTGGILLLRGDPANETSAVARFIGPFCVLLLLRRDSLYWAALIALVLLALTPANRARLLARSRAVWIGGGAIALSAVISLATGGGSASGVGGATRSGSFWQTLNRLPTYVSQLVGIVGWNDTYLPYWAYTLVEALVAFLVLGACLFGARRLAGVTGGLVVAVLAVPLLIGTIRYNYFQGRYEVGLAAGVPLVAALAIGEQLEARSLPWPKRAQVIGLLIMAFVQIDAFTQVLRRFSVGATASWWIFTRPQWTPPYGTLTELSLLFVVAVAALYLWLYRHSWPSIEGEHPRSPVVADVQRPPRDDDRGPLRDEVDFWPITNRDSAGIEDLGLPAEQAPQPDDRRPPRLR